MVLSSFIYQEQNIMRKKKHLKLKFLLNGTAQNFKTRGEK